MPLLWLLGKDQMSDETITGDLFPDAIIFDAVKKAVKEYKNPVTPICFVVDQIKFGNPSWDNDFILGHISRLGTEGFLEFPTSELLIVVANAGAIDI